MNREFLISCVQRNVNDESLDALLWSTASAEYEALAIQVYHQAGKKLSSALEDQTQTASLVDAYFVPNCPTAQTGMSCLSGTPWWRPVWSVRSCSASA